MEALAVPWFVLVRHLGPPLFLLVVGGTLLLWRPPRRRGLAWTALGTNLLAAALPFLWIAVQRAAGAGDLTVIGLAMTLLQPGLVVLAWLVLLWALVDPRSHERRPRGAAPDRVGDRVTENVG
ncbi:hypothetical protein GCM10007147_28700 [Nocardiopsis kunsanensis]|uniref:Uncharacterized protein n=1 Tax=Nocardiopsis kunsanensis TaxID=141693 RepID=A0A918XFJ7_9ACTN|nr:hypothetical protein [Nocardiopsis kunsanensis]GHD28609.1 hypothetical protein GCM10007147_28700 [Nocardiopsis kunsanensis]